ncbi:hypothetical protein [Mycobacterium tilburgii]|uniref:hypothetical protein n=1 Tax=Mycobacterium tilburgii TaxID=44467 RepID=UPI0028C3C3E8|nr:hypothetical protein [Mycobacterium tilburgii]
MQRLRIVHSSLNKPEPAGKKSSIADLATGFMPVALCAKALHLVLSRLPQPGVVTLATNTPGPRHRSALRRHRGMSAADPTDGLTTVQQSRGPQIRRQADLRHHRRLRRRTATAASPLESNARWHG